MRDSYASPERKATMVALALLGVVIGVAGQQPSNALSIANASPRKASPVAAFVSVLMELLEVISRRRDARPR